MGRQRSRARRVRCSSIRLAGRLRHSRPLACTDEDAGACGGAIAGKRPMRLSCDLPLGVVPSICPIDVGGTANTSDVSAHEGANSKMRGHEIVARIQFRCDRRADCGNWTQSVVSAAHAGAGGPERPRSKS